jgi:hypothetical protein
MKQRILKIRVTMVAMLLLSMVALPVWAANTKTTVEQVTTTVTVSEDVDYIITGATPFTSEGLVNITNTEHAVIILEAVKPSKAISSWLKNIKINGERAVNNTNCQVKLYNLGCIIMPYAKELKPLTVYSEQHFGGESCNDFGFEHTDGYMNTLTDEKLNNRIRSFKLKRGHMVTFALKDGGRGYSRCFIAADKDLEVATLPGILDNSISSYRVFKWYDAGKKQLANDMNTTTLAALNVQSSYDWGTGDASRLPDYEWVPNHIYEDWPSSRAIGRSTWSPHTKNNNEPRNSSDDHPQDLNTILGNWENMMRTGLRLCSPASWDGSDYWNATGFLADFLDSIDARGWRCDIIDLHCYWAEGNFGNIANWANKYKRPIWISEWCWGASWNSNGAFASGVTEADVKEALERICTRLNGWDYVERYYYWNGERDPSRLYKNGSLTAAGRYYAAMNSGLGYNGKYDFVPKTPAQYDPKNLTVRFDNNAKTATLSWEDLNGEMNASMTVQRRAGTGKSWVTIASIPLEDEAATYTYVDSAATNGCQYRAVVVDANNKERYTNVVMAASSDLVAGDALEIDGQTWYIGGNVMLNGNFEMGFTGWTDGLGNQLSAPYFQIVTAGGNDEGSYLQAYGNDDVLASNKSVNTTFAIKQNTNYYFSVSSSNMPSGYTNRLGLSKEGATATVPKVYINNTTPNWVTQYGNFNSAEYTQARLHLYKLESKAQIDQLLLGELFTNQADAIADGIEKTRQKAELFKSYNTKYESLNTALTEVLTTITATDAEALISLNRAVVNAIKAYELLGNSTLIGYAEKLAALNLHGVGQLEAAIATAKSATSGTDIVNAYQELEKIVAEYLPYTMINDKITNPNFKSTTGWTKCGTYIGGDQRIGTHDEVSCWNAWWSGINYDDTENTMAIKQEVKTNSSTSTHGLYALECKASTEHYCLSDQHAYFTDGNTTEYTQTLTADYLDLNIPVADRWQTLYTAPIYLDDNQTVTIGFEGSKKGSLDGAWLEVGNTTTGQKNDKREGWWCATDFAFRFTPLYKKTVVPDQWGVICLPYNVHASEAIKFYEIVGINADYTQLCLEEIDEATAGVPCIFKSTVADAMFFEYGNAVSKAVDGSGNIRGFFQSSASVPTDYFAMQDGAFQKVASTNRPKIGNYTGCMRKFTDNSAVGIPIMDEMTEYTLPIIGVTEEEKAKNNERVSGILSVQMKTNREDGIYTLDGRCVTNIILKPGLYIKVDGGRSYKTIIK